jgi:dihydroorotate dehydrogenase (NAD+) catalytic subunit
MARLESISRNLFGVHFQNPVLLAAGTAGFGRELDEVVDLEALGGLITKAVSRDPRQGNPAPRVCEFAGGMLNAIGLANPGLDHVRTDELPWLARRLTRARVIVNVVGFTEDEYVEVVQGLEEAPGVTALELNLSCPNTSRGGIEFGADCPSVTRIVERCRAATRRPLIVKLSPALPDIAGMALVARDAGADGVSLVNTLPGLLYDEAGVPRLGNGNGGVSGPALLPLGVLATRRVRDLAPDFPIIGVGGIRTADDVRQYLRAGASLTAIGTAALADPRLPERVARELQHG